MKKQFFSLLTAIGLISFLAVSCNQEALDITPNTYSGEEYFKSIFLLQGELTDQIPSLKHFAKYSEVESGESMVDIINKINQLDPLFFSDLKTAISSKNANKLEVVMDRGNALLEVNTLHNSTIDPIVMEQLANLNSSNYDLTNGADVKKFISALHRILNSSSKPSNGSVEEIGTEKCLFVVWAAVYYKWALWPKRTVGTDASPSGIVDSDKFFREKLVSEIMNLN